MLEADLNLGSPAVPMYRSRREFVRDLGLGAASLPFEADWGLVADPANKFDSFRHAFVIKCSVYRSSGRLCRRWDGRARIAAAQGLM